MVLCNNEGLLCRSNKQKEASQIIKNLSMGSLLYSDLIFVEMSKNKNKIYL